MVEGFKAVKEIPTSEFHGCHGRNREWQSMFSVH